LKKRKREVRESNRASGKVKENKEKKLFKKGWWDSKGGKSIMKGNEKKGEKSMKKVKGGKRKGRKKDGRKGKGEEKKKKEKKKRKK
jgi:hypothetical protein